MMADDAPACSPSSAAAPPATASISAAAAATITTASAPASAPPLQRGRSHEEMEIARHLIEHSQSHAQQPVSSSSSAATAQQQSQQSQHHPQQHRPSSTAAHPQRPSEPANGDIVMGGVDDHHDNGHPSASTSSTAITSSTEHHDLNDAVARARSRSPQPFPPGTPIVRTGSPSQRRAAQSAEAGSGGQACSNCGTTKTPLWRRSPAGEIICNACGLYYKARNQMRPVGLKRGASAAPLSTDGQPHDRSAPASSIQSQATYVSVDPNVNGTCPGGGRCNGTGGHAGCDGCPAYNNRISKTAQVALQQADPNAQAGSNVAGSHPQYRNVATSVVVACQNCGTTITPLWRRDEAGNTICNACGLYYKLHGSHRPVQMKKAEIKRRKRVVPASTSTVVTTQYTGSASPRTNDPMDAESPYTTSNTTESRASLAPSTTSSGGPDDAHLHTRPYTGPIPVDFTGAFRPRVQIVPTSPTASVHDSDMEDTRSIPRKRTISSTKMEDGPDPERHYPSNHHHHAHSRSPPSSQPHHHHPTSLTPAPTSTPSQHRSRPRPHEAVDPSLASSTTNPSISLAGFREAGPPPHQPQQHHHPSTPRSPILPSVNTNHQPDRVTSPSSTARSETREEKRRELQREAERMRKMLLLKERELAELGDEG